MQPSLGWVFLREKAFICKGFTRHPRHHPAPLITGDATTDTQLLEVFDQAWTEEDQLPLHYGKNETPQSLHELAERMLTAFHGSVMATPAGEIIGVEETLSATVHPELPDLLGRIDMMLYHPDAGTTQLIAGIRSTQQRISQIQRVPWQRLSEPQSYEEERAWR